jgi:Tc toxin complex TcA C-terminal TcB-binding domain
VIPCNRNLLISSSPEVRDWRNNPFSPHVIARGRPMAYMKWIVMTYIEILIAYGDSLFRQNSLESIPMAIQLYVLASHIYGPRGQKVPRQKTKTYTYNELATQYDAFSNALVNFEEAFPISNQTPLSAWYMSADSDPQFANIFGSAGTLYFQIPDNPTLRGLADTIDDRLFKIRHSQDINGVFRILPLNDPPIDPALLVRAAAQGLSLSSVLADLNGPMPNFRFQYLLQKAMDLANETKSLGQALLAAKERKDSEMLSSLQSKHELTTQNAIMDAKKLALDDANKALDVLTYNRKGVVSRLTYYLNLIGADLSGIPDIDNEFMEIVAKIDKPIDQGGLAMSPFEYEMMDKASQAATENTTIGQLETTAGAFNALPNVDAAGMPLGIGEDFKFGPGNMGALISAMARAKAIDVAWIGFQSSNAGLMAQSQRSLQDRILQANNAGYEISSIDKQITSANIKIAMASKDIDLQQLQIDQAQEITNFLNSKYTNTELYTWMDGSTKTIFYSMYSEAFSLAKKAEKAFLFERPQNAGTEYIQPGYWDPTRDGLLSGENLLMALKKLESAQLEDRGYDYEVSKSISLRRLDPKALINLREQGSCQFSLPEVLFDMDFPGHYLRRIRSVSITMPCLVGPYTTINATLRHNSSQYRIKPASFTSYAQASDTSTDGDSNLSTAITPISAIAVCSGQNDSGVFELNFQDGSTRYMPFEGAGVISSWTLELPPYPDFRQFDYDTITDVIISIKYTSLEGGEQLRSAAVTAVTNYFKAIVTSSTGGGLVALFDIKNEFATAWSRLVKTVKPPPPPTPPQSLTKDAQSKDQVSAPGILAKAKDTNTVQTTKGETSVAVPSSGLQPNNAAAGTSTTGSTAWKGSLDLPALNERLPMFAQGGSSYQAVAHDVWVLTDNAFPSDKLGLVTVKNGQPTTMKSTSDPTTGLQGYQLPSHISQALGDWQLTFAEGDLTNQKCWMLVWYSLVQQKRK